jgi:hypothetical protein
MMPEEILGKFMSRCMMAKEARYISDVTNGPLSHTTSRNPLLSKRRPTRRCSLIRWHKLRWLALIMI